MIDLPGIPAAAQDFEASERLLAEHVEEYLRILEEKDSVPDVDAFCQRAPESLRRQLRERCIDVRSIKRLLPATCREDGDPAERPAEHELSASSEPGILTPNPMEREP